MAEFTVKLSLDEWNIVIAGLGNIAYGAAAPIVTKIHDRVKADLALSQQATEEVATEVTEKE